MNDEMMFLATVTSEELPEYDTWMAEVEAKQDPDWANNWQ
jgi:hypothetical protein